MEWPSLWPQECMAASLASWCGIRTTPLGIINELPRLQCNWLLRTVVVLLPVRRIPIPSCRVMCWSMHQHSSILAKTSRNTTEAIQSSLVFLYLHGSCELELRLIASNKLTIDSIGSWLMSRIVLKSTEIRGVANTHNTLGTTMTETLNSSWCCR